MLPIATKAPTVNPISVQPSGQKKGDFDNFFGTNPGQPPSTNQNPLGQGQKTNPPPPPPQPPAEKP